MIHLLVLEITKAAVRGSDSGHSIDTGTLCFQLGPSSRPALIAHEVNARHLFVLSSFFRNGRASSLQFLDVK